MVLSPWVRPAVMALVLLIGSAICAAEQPESLPIDINRANADELAAGLPGIGPVKAQAIIEHRTRSGPYRSIDALLEVKGIGPATLEKIRPHIAGQLSLTGQGQKHGHGHGHRLGPAGYRSEQPDSSAAHGFFVIGPSQERPGQHQRDEAAVREAVAAIVRRARQDAQSPE